jgi:hypothetical protein
MRRYRPRVKRECPDVLGEVAVAALGWISPVCFRAVPRVQVLISVERASKGTPIVPVLLIRIYNISLVMATKVEAEQIFLCESKRNIKLGSYTSSFVTLVWTYKAHCVKRICVFARLRNVSVDKRLEDLLVDEGAAECLTVVMRCTPGKPYLAI